MQNTLATRRLQFEMDSEMQMLYAKFKNRFGGGLTNKKLMKKVFTELAEKADITTEENRIKQEEIKIFYYKDFARA